MLWAKLLCWREEPHYFYSTVCGSSLRQLEAFFSLASPALDSSPTFSWLPSFFTSRTTLSRSPCCFLSQLFTQAVIKVAALLSLQWGQQLDYLGKMVRPESHRKWYMQGSSFGLKCLGAHVFRILLIFWEPEDSYNISVSPEYILCFSSTFNSRLTCTKCYNILGDSSKNHSKKVFELLFEEVYIFYYHFIGFHMFQFHCSRTMRRQKIYCPPHLPHLCDSKWQSERRGHGLSVPWDISGDFTKWSQLWIERFPGEDKVNLNSPRKLRKLRRPRKLIKLQDSLGPTTMLHKQWIMAKEQRLFSGAAYKLYREFHECSFCKSSPMLGSVCFFFL